MFGLVRIKTHMVEIEAIRAAEIAVCGNGLYEQRE